jgi:hypothetical protein
MSLLWKIGMGAVAIAAAFLLIKMYGGGQYARGKADERSAWQGEMVKAEQGKLAAYQRGVASVMNADKQYINTVREKIVPIRETIIQRSADYAKTPDGASICLPSERVLWLEQTSRLLFPATPTASADSLDDAVHAYAMGEDAGWLNEPSAGGDQSGQRSR